MATVRLSASYLSYLKLNKQLSRINSIYRIRLLSSYCNDNSNKSSNIVRSRISRQELTNNFLVPNNLNCWISKRWKSKKQKISNKNQDDSDDEDEKIDDEISSVVVGNKNNKIISTHVSSMRIDSVVKAGMGIARNKAEAALYESKLRVNGEKVLKKGYLIGLEDEIDFIHGPSPKNPDFLLVTRLTVLSASDHPEGYKIKLLREKSLTIENYKDTWKSSTGNPEE